MTTKAKAALRQRKKTTKTGKPKQATTKTLVTISDDCGNVLAFLQAVAVKSP